MTTSLMATPRQRYFANNGTPAAGCKLYTYVAGTTTPKATYSDNAGTVHANPITLDAKGEAVIYWSGSYKVDLKTAAGVQITGYPVDNVTSYDTLVNVGDALIRADLAAPSGSLMVGANAYQTQADVNKESIVVTSKGAHPSKTATENTIAFNAAITECLAAGKALIIPSGPYLLEADGVDFSGQGLQIVGCGLATLQFTGAGRAFVLNGGTAGLGIGGMKVENLLILGGPDITDGFYSTGVWRSSFKDIEVRECNNNAFTILHGVSNQYDSLKYSTNEAAQTTTPTNGLVLDNAGAGYYTANCTFTNPVMEGFAGRGIYLVDASGNTFTGGTSEGVAVGVTSLATSGRNHFAGLWCEANTTRDLEINGVANSFDDCYFGSNTPSGNNVEITTGQGTLFRGGFVRIANLQSTSRDTAFIGTAFSAGLAGITGTGTYTRIGATALDINGVVVSRYPDVLGAVDSIVFPAVQVPSANVNTLDDYEEVTWTPALVPAAGSITANGTYTGGRYTKIGNLVTLNATVYVSSVSTPSGLLKLTGLPFVTNITPIDYNCVTISVNDLAATATGQIMATTEQGQGYIVIRKFAAGALSEMGADIQANSTIRISASFQVYQP
jgi:hypothetical protein